MNRLKGAIRQKKKNKESKGHGRKDKKEAERKFGDFRFDYIKACKHDLNGQCPLCKMANQISNVFLREEKAQRDHNRIESHIRRANLRYELLSGWAHNQNLFVQGLNDAQLGCEIVLSGQVALALIRTCESGGLDFKVLDKLSDLRTRIIQIGHEVATFLQCRIRKWLVKRRVRTFMLQRFRWEPGTRMRPKDTWVDTLTDKRYFDTPVLLRHERPASPRAIQRRINSEKRKLDSRKKVYNDWLPKILADKRYKTFQRNVQDLRQLALLQDMVEIGMRYMEMEKVNDPADALKANKEEAGLLEPELDSTEEQDPEALEAAMKKKEEEAAAAAAKLPTYFYPALSAPFPPMRHITLQIALDTEPPVEPEASMSTPTSGTKDSSASSKPARGGRPSSTPPPEKPKVKMTLNQKFLELEKRRWAAMRCETSEDVLKILVHDENHPTYCSLLHIASDEYQVWQGDLGLDSDDEDDDIPATGEVGNGNAAEVELVVREEAEKEEEDEDPDDLHVQLQHEAGRASVLPVFLKLHRFPGPSRGANGHFRLFFHDEQLVAVTQGACLAYYAEIYNNRKAIVGELRAFGRHRLVQKLLQKAAQSARERREKKRRLGSSMLAGEIRDRMLKLYAPAERELYGDNVHFRPYGKLDDEDVIALAQRHEFLFKVSTFKERFRQAQKAIRIKRNSKGKKKKKAEKKADDNGFGFDFSASNVKSISLEGGRVLREKKKGDIVPLPVPQDRLSGYDVFERNVLRLPGGVQNVMNLRKRCEKGMRPMVVPKPKEMEFGLTPIPPDTDDLDKPPEIERLEPYSVYHECISQLASVTDVEFSNRVVNDTIEAMLEEARKRDHEETPPLIYDLGVMDVTINMDDKPMQVQLLEMVGVFSSQGVQAPPALDCGLIEWETLRRSREQALAAQGSAEDEEMQRLFNRTGAHPVLGNVNRPDSRGADRPGSRGSGDGASRPTTAASGDGWTEPISEDNTESSSDLRGSGISIYQSVDHSNDSTFECRLLGAPMSPRYVETHFPAGICRWVGLERRVPKFSRKKED